MATHPPATAGGTDLFQVRLLTFEAKPIPITDNAEITEIRRDRGEILNCISNVSLSSLYLPDDNLQSL